MLEFRNDLRRATAVSVQHLGRLTAFVSQQRIEQVEFVHQIGASLVGDRQGAIDDQLRIWMQRKRCTLHAIIDGVHALVHVRPEPVEIDLAKLVTMSSTRLAVLEQWPTIGGRAA